MLAHLIIYTLWIFVWYDMIFYDSAQEKELKDKGKQRLDV